MCRPDKAGSDMSTKKGQSASGGSGDDDAKNDDTGTANENQNQTANENQTANQNQNQTANTIHTPTLTPTPTPTPTSTKKATKRVRREKRDKIGEYTIIISGLPKEPKKKKKKKTSKALKKHGKDNPSGGLESLLPSLIGVAVLVIAVMAQRGFRGRASVAGIDLGTTNSVICVQRPSKGVGVIDCVEDPLTNSPIVPSVVSVYDPQRDVAEIRVGPSSKTKTLLDPHPTRVVVGHAAKRRIDTHPHHTLYNAKRVLGRPYNDVAVDELRREVEFRIEEEPQVDMNNNNNKDDKDDKDDNTSTATSTATKTKTAKSTAKSTATKTATSTSTLPLESVFRVDEDTTLTPQQVGGHVVNFLMGLARDFLGHDNVRSAVLAVPAKFDAHQRKRTFEAFKLAGVTVARVLEEPTAAALAYGLHKKEGVEKILVYDFGGGTLDISILHVSEGYCDVMGSDGDDRLGGADFDVAIAHLLAQQHSSVLENLAAYGKHGSHNSNNNSSNNSNNSNNNNNSSNDDHLAGRPAALLGDDFEEPKRSRQVRKKKSSSRILVDAEDEDNTSLQKRKQLRKKKSSSRVMEFTGDEDKDKDNTSLQKKKSLRKKKSSSRIHANAVVNAEDEDNASLQKRKSLRKKKSSSRMASTTTTNYTSSTTGDEDNASLQKKLLRKKKSSSRMATIPDENDQAEHEAEHDLAAAVAIGATDEDNTNTNTAARRKSLRKKKSSSRVMDAEDATGVSASASSRRKLLQKQNSSSKSMGVADDSDSVPRRKLLRGRKPSSARMPDEIAEGNNANTNANGANGANTEDRPVRRKKSTTSSTGPVGGGGGSEQVLAPLRGGDQPKRFRGSLAVNGRTHALGNRKELIRKKKSSSSRKNDSVEDAAESENLQEELWALLNKTSTSSREKDKDKEKDKDNSGAPTTPSNSPIRRERSSSKLRKKKKKSSLSSSRDIPKSSRRSGRSSRGKSDPEGRRASDSTEILQGFECDSEIDTVVSAVSSALSYDSFAECSLDTTEDTIRIGSRILAPSGTTSTSSSSSDHAIRTQPRTAAAVFDGGDLKTRPIQEEPSSDRDRRERREKPKKKQSRSDLSSSFSSSSKPSNSSSSSSNKKKLSDHFETSAILSSKLAELNERNAKETLISPRYPRTMSSDRQSKSMHSRSPSDNEAAVSIASSQSAHSRLSSIAERELTRGQQQQRPPPLNTTEDSTDNNRRRRSKSPRQLLIRSANAMRQSLRNLSSHSRSVSVASEDEASMSVPGTPSVHSRKSTVSFKDTIPEGNEVDYLPDERQHRSFNSLASSVGGGSNRDLSTEFQHRSFNSLSSTEGAGDKPKKPKRLSSLLGAKAMKKSLRSLLSSSKDETRKSSNVRSISQAFSASSSSFDMEDNLPEECQPRSFNSLPSQRIDTMDEGKPRKPARLSSLLTPKGMKQSLRSLLSSSGDEASVAPSGTKSAHSRLTSLSLGDTIPEGSDAEDIPDGLQLRISSLESSQSTQSQRPDPPYPSDVDDEDDSSSPSGSTFSYLPNSLRNLKAIPSFRRKPSRPMPNRSGEVNVSKSPRSIKAMKKTNLVQSSGLATGSYHGDSRSSSPPSNRRKSLKGIFSRARGKRNNSSHSIRPTSDNINRNRPNSASYLVTNKQLKQKSNDSSQRKDLVKSAIYACVDDNESDEFLFRTSRQRKLSSKPPRKVRSLPTTRPRRHFS